MPAMLRRGFPDVKTKIPADLLRLLLGRRVISLSILARFSDTLLFDKSQDERDEFNWQFLLETAHPPLHESVCYGRDWLHGHQVDSAAAAARP